MASGNGLSLTNVDRLKHFLRMGQDSGCYQPGMRPLTKDKISCIEQLIADRQGVDVVQIAVQFHHEHIGTRSDTVPFVLAQCAHSSDQDTKKAAYAAISEVCQTPQELFSFIKCSELLSKPSTGWGRAQRKIVANWYNSQNAKQLTETVTRYKRRHHWSHRDLLMLSHLTPVNKSIGVVLKYVMRGLDVTKKEFGGDECTDEIQEIFIYLQAVEDLKHTNDEHFAARLIENHNLTFEHVPTPFFKSKEVWTALIPRIPVNVLLQYLPRLSQLGYVRPNNPMVPLIVEQLNTEVKNQQCRLQPTEIYLALKKYEESGKSPSGRPAKHRPIPLVLEALHNLYLTSFKNIPSTGQNFLIAIDVRNQMVHSKIPGCPQLTPAVATALLTLGLLHSEASGLVKVVAFSSRDMSPLELRSDMHFNDVTKCMRETPMGPVNCTKPLVWAIANKIPVDVFVICTDNQTKPGELHPADALREYRQAMNLHHTKMVVCAMASKGFTIAAADDPGMLDIAGFDCYVPKIISHFAKRQ